MEVPDLPRFEVGQSAVLFVVGNGKQFCPLVGIAQGRFHVVRDAATGRERIFTDDLAPVSSTAEIGKVDAAGNPLLQRHVARQAQQGAAGDKPAMTVEDFRSEVLNKVSALSH